MAIALCMKRCGWESILWSSIQQLPFLCSFPNQTFSTFWNLRRSLDKRLVLWNNLWDALGLRRGSSTFLKWLGTAAKRYLIKTKHKLLYFYTYNTWTLKFQNSTNSFIFHWNKYHHIRKQQNGQNVCLWVGGLVDFNPFCQLLFLGVQYLSP